MLLDEDVEFLEHFGKKGMRWGVRNEVRLERAKAVASGTANKLETVRFASTDTSSRVIKRTGSVQAAAKLRESQLQARKDRVIAGKGTAKDFLALHGGDRLVPSIKLEGSKVDKAPRAERTAAGRKMVAATLAGGIGIATVYSLSTRGSKAPNLEYGKQSLNYFR